MIDGAARAGIARDGLAAKPDCFGWGTADGAALWLNLQIPRTLLIREQSHRAKLKAPTQFLNPKP